jgi:hypothetical protein
MHAPFRDPNPEHLKVMEGVVLDSEGNALGRPATAGGAKVVHLGGPMVFLGLLAIPMLMIAGFFVVGVVLVVMLLATVLRMVFTRA